MTKPASTLLLRLFLQGLFLVLYYSTITPSDAFLLNKNNNVPRDYSTKTTTTTTTTTTTMMTSAVHNGARSDDNSSSSSSNKKNPIDVLGIDHVVLKVDDLERMAEWYKTVLGCRVAKHNVALLMIHLDAGSALIDLVDNAGPLGDNNNSMNNSMNSNDNDEDNNNNNDNDNDNNNDNQHQKLDHICLGLKEFDAAAIREHLSSNGVAITTEVAVRYGKGGNGESLFFHDPEGNRIEIKKSLYTC